MLRALKLDRNPLTGLILIPVKSAIISGKLRKADIGVEMGNAGDDVKASAGYVTTAVDADSIHNAMKALGII